MQKILYLFTFSSYKKKNFHCLQSETLFVDKNQNIYKNIIYIYIYYLISLVLTKAAAFILASVEDDCLTITFNLQHTAMEWGQYLGGYMADLHQILYTSRGFPQDLASKFSDHLRSNFRFYGSFNFKQKNLLVRNLKKQNA